MSMSNNTTIEYDGGDSLWVYVTWGIQGTVMSISNLLIVIAIFRYQALRRNKQYVVLFGLALADFSQMVGYTIGGIRRTILIVGGLYGTQMDQWECMLVPHTIFWTFGEHWVGLMLVAVSFDRLLAWVSPSAYRELTYRYAVKIVIGTFMFSSLDGLVPGLVLSFANKGQLGTVTAACYAGEVLGKAMEAEWYRVYYRWFLITCAVASIVMYAGVWWLYKTKHLNTVEPADDENEWKRKMERKMTITLGITVLCTLFIYLIPSIIASLAIKLGAKSSFYQTWFILANFNSFCNIFIFVVRHNEMKMAIKGLFANKDLPLNLAMWQINADAGGS